MPQKASSFVALQCQTVQGGGNEVGTEYIFRGSSELGAGRFFLVGTIVFLRRRRNIRHFIQSRRSCYPTEGLHAWQDKGSGYRHAESP